MAIINKMEEKPGHPCKSDSYGVTIVPLSLDGEDQCEMLDDGPYHWQTVSCLSETQKPVPKKLLESIVVVSQQGECVTNTDAVVDDHRKSPEAWSRLNISPEASILAKGSSVHGSDMSDSQEDQDIDKQMMANFEVSSEVGRETEQVEAPRRKQVLSRSTIPEEDEYVYDLDTKSNDEKLQSYKSSNTKEFTLKLRPEQSDQSTKPSDLTHSESQQSSEKSQIPGLLQPLRSNSRLDELAPAGLHTDQAAIFGFDMIKPAKSVKRPSKLGR